METTNKTKESAQRDANGRFTSKNSNPINGETLSGDFKAHTDDTNQKGIESNAVDSNAVKSDTNASNGSAPKRDENGRFTKQTGKPDSSGYYISVTGADDNLFIYSLFKAFNEMLIEVFKGYINTEFRFKDKFENARCLFSDHYKILNRNIYNTYKGIELEFGTPTIKPERYEDRI